MIAAFLGVLLFLYIYDQHQKWVLKNTILVEHTIEWTGKKITELETFPKGTSMETIKSFHTAFLRVKYHEYNLYHVYFTLKVHGSYKILSGVVDE